MKPNLFKNTIQIGLAVIACLVILALLYWLTRIFAAIHWHGLTALQLFSYIVAVGGGLALSALMVGAVMALFWLGRYFIVGISVEKKPVVTEAPAVVRTPQRTAPNVLRQGP